MAAHPFRVVLDTNILLRGLLNMRSASGRVVEACDSRVVVLLLSKPVISEYRAVLTAPQLWKVTRNWHWRRWKQRWRGCDTSASRSEP